MNLRFAVSHVISFGSASFLHRLLSGVIVIMSHVHSPFRGNFANRYHLAMNDVSAGLLRLRKTNTFPLEHQLTMKKYRWLPVQNPQSFA
jgi:hypothetical protein